MTAELSEPLLLQLAPAQVRLAAVGAGWKLVEGVKRGAVVLNHPTDGLSQIRLPSGPDDPDYAHRMRDAVLKLAASQNRDPAELLYELALPPADVLHLRLRSHDAENGTLPLALGVKLSASSQQLLTAAACSAHDPRAYYPNPTFGPVTDYLGRCRWGQSLNGTGYAATVIAPVVPMSQPSLLDGLTEPGWTPDEQESLAVSQAPFERRVTLTLMRALRTLRTALDTGGPTGTPENVERGVSANLCDALTGVSVGDQRAFLEVGVGWSRTLPGVPSRLAPTIMFAQPEITILAATSRELKRLTSRHTAISGRVIELHTKHGNPPGELAGTVIVRVELSGQWKSVQFALKGDEYRLACDAHRDQLTVEASGLLTGDAGSRTLKLTLPRGFRVLTPTPVRG